MQIV